MVSSFVILTNIKVDKETAKAFKAFNEISDNFFSLEITANVPAYFDSTNFDNLDDFLSTQNLNLERIDNNIWSENQNWCFRRNYEGEYLLTDGCEKFHGSISYLHYFIEKFFEPRGIKLNGTIVGVNTEMPIAYVYDVVDNQIKLNKIATKKAIKSCKIVYEDDLLQDAFDPREFANSLLYKWAI